jgi:hypothetical protein
VRYLEARASVMEADGHPSEARPVPLPHPAVRRR